MPRSRSPRHEQRFPDEDRIAVGHPLHDQHNGTPSLRSMRDDSEQRRQQHISSAVAGRLSLRHEVGGELDSSHGPGHVFQKKKPIHRSCRKRRIRLAKRGKKSSFVYMIVVTMIFIFYTKIHYIDIYALYVVYPYRTETHLTRTIFQFCVVF